MRQITEVLRLNAQGLSYRQIAQSVGISASTVQSYLERAERAGLSWPLPDDVDEATLEGAAIHADGGRARPGRPEPNWRVHLSVSAARHVTLQLLHLEYKAAHPEGVEAIRSSVSITDAGALARTWSCVWSTPPASACLSTSRATRCRLPTPRRVRSGTPRCL